MTSRHGPAFAAGLAGVAGFASYLLAVLVPWPDTQLGTSLSLVVVSLWPLLSIVYAHGLYAFVAEEGESTANRLAFVFGVAAFTTVLAMIIVQLAVGTGIAEVTKGMDEQAARTLRRGLRLVDAGLDVAWDFLIATALVLWGVAVRRRRGLGIGWGAPSIVFGVALIALNAATFPWPPATRGLFDIGPFIAVFMLALAVRLAVLGRRGATAAPRGEDPGGF